MSEVLKRAWVVIPAHREAKVLQRVVRGVRRLAPRVVVDDGSTDETTQAALAAGATVLRHAVNLGQGAALQTGIDCALAQGAEFLFTFDADGQYPAESLSVMADVLEKIGADVVLGSRTLGSAAGIPAARRFLLKAAVVFTWMHARLRVTDTHNGLRPIQRAAALRVRIPHARMAHASETVSQIRQLGPRFEEAPVTIYYTEYSLAKGQN